MKKQSKSDALAGLFLAGVCVPLSLFTVSAIDADRIGLGVILGILTIVSAVYAGNKLQKS